MARKTSCPVPLEKYLPVSGGEDDSSVRAAEVSGLEGVVNQEGMFTQPSSSLPPVGENNYGFGENKSGYGCW
ncbi:MAG: hypothetical protein Q7R96_01370 [Nanoarchaeota archaeon]|nr:hypothetical protein [Nanoarchaeota archaeon]